MGTLNANPAVPSSGNPSRSRSQGCDGRRHARFTVAEFHRLCDQLPERRLELIDGEVLEVIAKGSRHTAAVHRLARALTPLLDGHRDGGAVPGYELRIEAPLNLGEHQEPEPDLAVVTARADAWLEAHPSAADTLLVIEVADASLTYDLDTKLRLYQQAGIANYWVVDVREPMVFYLLQGPGESALLARLRQPVEALMAELRALG
ncbi:Uma2 family endonuclease [Cyanobium sp. FGCU-6]|nr:Uma2 family endonuclease [Cyanobium sp. FGCU6]